ncbi:MAG TPA: hypothetical protein VGB85_13230 [Nannocystis sp.]|jgi:hypothetical protein
MAFRAFQGPDFNFDSLTVEGGPLATQLAAWSARAVAAGHVPCVYLTAGWCPPSVKLEKSLADPAMALALRDVAAATLDVDAWGDELTAAGFSARSIPVFYALDDEGRPSGQSITGAAWGENTPENMGPPLGRFFDALRDAQAPERFKQSRDPSPVTPDTSVTPAGPPEPRSRAARTTMVIAALVLLGLIAFIKVYLDGEQQHEQDTTERDSRIQQDIQRSIQDSLKKQ